MSTVIKVENISKSYLIGHQASDKYRTFRDVLSRGVKDYGKRLLHPFRSSSGQPLQGVGNVEEFWALKDINFEVKEGDRVAIIGRNGAGKSTLLKVLSRITEPSFGQFEINGRVASLLEVGTGFHQELTGKENIYLNGAILGMKKNEIKRKFDEIVSFAGVERFLDTPVKRYSSGMHVRLAFAVAAHLDPEVLIIDEVLAVGDAEFQKKCIGKMDEVSKEGRTILFVSHNMHAVRSLCNYGVLLEDGCVQRMGSVDEVIDQYLNANPLEAKSMLALPTKNINSPVIGGGIELSDCNGAKTAQFNLKERWGVRLEFELNSPLPHVIAAVGLVITSGVALVTFWSKPTDLSAGVHCVEFEVDLPIKACHLTLTVGISSRERAVYYEEHLGYIIINEVAIEGDQPFRASGGGVLLCPESPEISTIRNGLKKDIQ